MGKIKVSKPKTRRVFVDLTPTAVSRITEQAGLFKRTPYQQATFVLERLHCPDLPGELPTRFKSTETSDESRTIIWGLDVLEKPYYKILALGKRKGRKLKQQATYDLLEFFDPDSVSGVPEGWTQNQGVVYSGVAQNTVTAPQ